MNVELTLVHRADTVLGGSGEFARQVAQAELPQVRYPPQRQRGNATIAQLQITVNRKLGIPTAATRQSHSCKGYG
jgi:hypothetical protein